MWAGRGALGRVPTILAVAFALFGAACSSDKLSPVPEAGVRAPDAEPTAADGEVDAAVRPFRSDAMIVLVDHDGGRGGSCDASCDCLQGEGCVEGACRQLSNPVWCCSKPDCPAAELCLDTRDRPGHCPVYPDAGPDAGVVDTGPGQIGAGCASNVDCDMSKGYTCWTRDQPPFIWGYCTLLNCTPMCPSGSRCVQFNLPAPNPPVTGCMQSCLADRDCRSDAYCLALPGAGSSICFPDCRDDLLDCTPRDGSVWCNRTTGLCEATPMQSQTAIVGDPCVSNEDCGPGDACAGETGWFFPGGMCTRICSGLPEAMPCGANETCQPLAGVGLCFRNCVAGLCPNRANAMCFKLDPSWTTPSCIAN
jgi:hypothetical protein